MHNTPEFYAPSMQETTAALNDELIQEFTAYADTLVEQFGPLSGDFNLLGWVWVQASLAERVGITEPMDLMRGLAEGYQALQQHLAHG